MSTNANRSRTATVQTKKRASIPKDLVNADARKGHFSMENNVLVRCS